MALKLFKLLFVILFTITFGKDDQYSDIREEMDYKINYQVSLLKMELEYKLSNYEQEISDKIETKKESLCDSDWVSYSDRKCYKVLERKGSESEAKTNCSQLDKSSTLITIFSNDEQKFVENYLKSFHNISNNVWIGLEYINKTFQWMDGNELIYENWDENTVKNGSNKCVQMTISESNLGLWRVDNCKNNYLIVCQVEQLSRTVINEELSKVKAQIKEQEKEISILNNKLKLLENQSFIPPGFIYIQLPNQTDPKRIWPNFQWKDITKIYAGLFFRAEGGNSASFKAIQDEDFTFFDSVKLVSFCYPPRDSRDDGRLWYEKKIFDDKTNISSGWTDNLAYGKECSDTDRYRNALNVMKFNINTGENRPKNTAIKIWKRLKWKP